MTHRRFLEGLFKAWRAGDAVRSAAHFALDGAYREAGGDAIVGREAIHAHFTRFFRDGPRFEFLVDATLVEGDRAAVSYRFATYDVHERRHERSGCALVTFVNGTVAEWREYGG